MPHRRSVAAANAAADGICTLADEGYVGIFTAPQPDTPDDAPSGDMLVRCDLSLPAFALAVNGESVANAIADGVAVASGTADWYRIFAADGSAVTDDECGLTGSGKALELRTLSINVGDRVTIPSFSHTEPTHE